MTVKLTAGWDVKSCDDCGSMNDTEDEFPEGWCVLVVSDGDAMRHQAFCPECDPRSDAQKGSSPS